jgi:UDP-galactopyranose mutase
MLINLSTWLCLEIRMQGLTKTMKTYNTSFERVDEFKYLGRNSTNPNSIQEEIKCRLKSGNACYHLVQHLLSTSLLSKNLKIKYIEL